MSRIVGFFRQLTLGSRKWRPFVPVPLVIYRDDAGNVLNGDVLMRRHGPDRQWQYRKASDEETSLYMADSLG